MKQTKLLLMLLLMLVPMASKSWVKVVDGIRYYGGFRQPYYRTVWVAGLEDESYSGGKDIPSKITIDDPNTEKEDYITYDVVQIDDHAFSNCINLTTITIPSSVKTIGGGAFKGCSSLYDVTISEGVTKIYGSAFDGCVSLKGIIIPNSVTSIGSCVFRGCSNLISPTISENVTIIESSTFEGCTSMTYVKIPNGVTSIENSAFANCSSLPSIDITNCVISIGENAFEGCSSLPSIGIPNSVTSIGANAFKNCSSLTSIIGGNNVTKIGSQAFYKSGLKSVVIPNSVTEIGSSAFSNCNDLESVTIGSGLVSMGQSAFSYCKNLTNVTISEGVKEIASTAFYKCSSLPEITIPNSVTVVGGSAFAGCSNLTNATIGDHVETIGDRAFEDCSNLLEIKIPDSVTDLGKSCFTDCSNLTSAILGNGIEEIKENTFYKCEKLQGIEIPYSVKKIGKSAFEKCKSLISVILGKGVIEIEREAFSYCSSLPMIEIPLNVTTIGYGCFFYCKNLKKVNLYPINVGKWFAGFDIEELFIGESVECIGEEAFKTCKQLKTVVFADASQLKTIDKRAFYQCYKLEEVILPMPLKDIGIDAFRYCNALKTLSFPESLTSIGWYAFSGCEALEYINAKMLHPFAIDDNVFSAKTYNDAELQVNENEDEYRETFAWSKFFHIIKIGETPREGDGGKDSNNYKKAEEPDNGGGNTITTHTYYYDITAQGNGEIVVDEQTSETNIGTDERWTYSFEGLIVRDEQRNVEIPHYRDHGVPFKFIPDEGNKVKHVLFTPEKDGEQQDVTKELVYDETIKGYTYECVEKGSYPKLVVVFESTSTDSQNDGETFSATVDGLTFKVTILNADNKTCQISIDTPLTENREITIPSIITDENGTEYTVAGIGDNAFTNCTTLTSLTIPASVITIGEAALAGCTGVTAFIVEEGNQSFTVEDGVLYDKEKTTLVACPAGKSGTVTIPGTVATIEANGFYNCSKLTSIELPSSLKRIKDAAFVGCSSLTTMNIPASMNRYSIGLGAFTGCTNMESFTVSEGSKGYAAKDGVLYLLDPMGLGTLSELVAYPNKRGDTYTVPSTVGMINSYAFCMTDIRELTLPYMSQVANYAVAYCPKLEKITSTAAVPGWNNFATAFTGSLDTATLYVPSGSKALYQATEGWKEFGSNIVESGGDGDTYFVDNANNFYKITGDETVTLVGINEGAEKLTIPATTSYGGKTYAVTDVSSGQTELSIARFSLPRVQELEIPAGVTKIGDWAFYQSLRKTASLEIPGTVKEIGNWTFAMNDNLASLTLNEGLEKIGEGAFSSCYSLSKVEIPSGVTSIGSSAFSGVYESVTIPASVQFIGRYAFLANSPEESLRVNISDLDAWCKIESDGGYWEEPVRFYNLYKDGVEVTEVAIPDGMTSISKVFHSCSNLSKVTIPSSVTDVNCAFYWCKNLRTVVNLSADPQPIDLYYVDSGTRAEGDYHMAFQYVEKNECTLYVPQGSMTTYSLANGWKDFSHILEIDHTAVRGIMMDGEPFDVYNLLGYKVLSGVNSLNGLPKGIYIVNGRKVRRQ